MSDPRAGQPAEPSDLVDVAHLVTAYYTGVPDPDDLDQQVAFGTSGHRGSSLRTAFNETHILATTQAICDHRREQGYDGPLFLGRDTHGLSEPAWATALEVLAANDVTVLVDDRRRLHADARGVARDPARQRRPRPPGRGLADGIVVTPSHNPPTDGGFKYNPPHGGPADSDATSAIATRANELIRDGLAGVQRVAVRARPGPRPRRTTSWGRTSTTCRTSSTSTRSASAGVRIGADPLGGASVDVLGRDRRAARPRPDRRRTRWSTRPGGS